MGTIATISTLKTKIKSEGKTNANNPTQTRRPHGKDPPMGKGGRMKGNGPEFAVASTTIERANVPWGGGKKSKKKKKDLETSFILVLLKKEK